jgi:hypothetical protein
MTGELQSVTVSQKLPRACRFLAPAVTYLATWVFPEAPQMSILAKPLQFETSTRIASVFRRLLLIESIRVLELPFAFVPSRGLGSALSVSPAPPTADRLFRLETHRLTIDAKMGQHGFAHHHQNVPTPTQALSIQLRHQLESSILAFRSV